MTSETNQYEIYLVCNENGVVNEIINPHEHTAVKFKVGMSFTLNIFPESFGKSLALFQEMNSNKLAVDHEMEFIIASKRETLYLTAFKKNNAVMILAKSSAGNLTKIDETLIAMNHDKFDDFRTVLKETTK